MSCPPARGGGTQCAEMVFFAFHLLPQPYGTQISTYFPLLFFTLISALLQHEFLSLVLHIRDGVWQNSRAQESKRRPRRSFRAHPGILLTMSRVSDLIQDAELQTRFHPEYTVHIYTESGLTVRERAILREEYWKRQRNVGSGSYGSVWLEQCVKGRGEVEVRAVKQVVKSLHGSKQIDYNRELEAISKFSHRKVL